MGTGLGLALSRKKAFESQLAPSEAGAFCGGGPLMCGLTWAKAFAFSQTRFSYQ